MQLVLCWGHWPTLTSVLCGVISIVLIAFSYMQTSILTSSIFFFKNAIFFFSVLFLACLSKVRYSHVCRFTSTSAVVFHWPMCPFFLPIPCVFITIGLYYNLKLAKVIPLVVLLFLRIGLAILCVLFSHVKPNNVSSRSVKNYIGILMEILWNL